MMPEQMRMRTLTRTAWAGRVLSGVAVLFLTVDASMKLLHLAPAVDATSQLGYPAAVVVPLGLLQIVCLIIYLVPRTAPLGAILWTGYLVARSRHTSASVIRFSAMFSSRSTS